MRFLGLDIRRAESVEKQALVPVRNQGGWWPLVRESYTGAWQQNVETKLETVLTNPAAFRCQSIISSDIAKLGIWLYRENENIRTKIENREVAALLRRPNRYQNRLQFIESWMMSKLSFGNTYVLKAGNGPVPTSMYVLDPQKVTPLQADDGSVFYQLNTDALHGIPGDGVTVPASEIIHDRWNTLYHPLVGQSPIYAAGVAAQQGLNIQNGQTQFFGNGARPSGILTAPGPISDETAARLKAHWESGYSGTNTGKTAVLGDGLEYTPVSTNAVDAQLIEQLEWSAKTVCGVYGVPAYKAGIGEDPKYDNISAMNTEYYAQCLQIHIESIEELLHDALSLEQDQGMQFDIDALLRMDPVAAMEVEGEAVKGGIKSPNESRERFNLPPVPGGEYPYLQQQNYSLEDLARRSELPDEEPTGLSSEEQDEVLRHITKELANV